MEEPEKSGFARSYSSPITTLKLYWKNYGGLSALLYSPFLHVALVFGLLCAVWPSSSSWSEKTISIIPSLLGLTLAGYAILLAIGSERFLKRLARPGKTGRSVLENLSTAFLHFVLVQAGALVLAILAEPLSAPIKSLLALRTSEPLGATILFAFRWLGWTSLFYSITCSLAATFRLFRMVRWVVKDLNDSNPPTASGQ